MNIVSSSTFRDIPVEKVQSYWDVRPCNIRHSTKPVGSEEYFHEVEYRKYRVEPHIPSFAEFERWRGKKVLEIGCGIGTDTVNFARHGAEVTAVDLSENSLALARQRAQVFGLQDRIRFYHGNAEKLSEFLPPDQYDLVYSFGVIHHTPHPERVLREIRKYIKPEGTVKIMVYYRWSLVLESVLDPLRIRAVPVLASARDGGLLLRSPDGLSGHLHLFQARSPPLAGR
jgi:SAM-dependent methyltransferase